MAVARKRNQPDTSAPTNRIAAGSWRSLKSVGRREHMNVIRNTASIIELMLKDDWRVFEACGNGVVQELLIATQATENHRNLFCFNRDERRST